MTCTICWQASNPLFSDSSQSDDDDDAYKLIAMPQADYNFMAVVQGVQQAKVTDPLSENEDLLGEKFVSPVLLYKMEG